MTLTVDDQPYRRAKQPEPELRLRDTDILQLPQPLIKEGLSLQEFYEADGWIETEPMDLSEVRG